jgi:hypothetical protein
MALRIRKDGRILCAAMHPEEPGDTYLDDGVHYTLSRIGVLVTEKTEEGGRGGHACHGEWWGHWVPSDVTPDLWANNDWNNLVASRC